MCNLVRSSYTHKLGPRTEPEPTWKTCDQPVVTAPRGVRVSESSKSESVEMVSILVSKFVLESGWMHDAWLVTSMFRDSDHPDCS